MLIDAPRQRPDLISARGQKLHGNGADAAGGAGYEHGAVDRRKRGPLQTCDRKGGGVAGGADRGGFLRGETLGHAGDVFSVDAHLRGVAAVAALADAAAVDGDKRAVLEGAHDVDARHRRQFAQDAAVARKRHRVLVVHRGVAHVDQGVALARECRLRLHDLRSIFSDNQAAVHGRQHRPTLRWGG